MTYKLNGKSYNIPNEYIEMNMSVLGITQMEAIQMYLEDEGILDNEEQNVLDSKAKKVKVKKEAKADKPKMPRKPREPKADPDKEYIITQLSNFLTTLGIESEITNKAKIVEFNYNNNHYKLDLVRQRAKK